MLSAYTPRQQTYSYRFSLFFFLLTFAIQPTIIIFLRCILIHGEQSCCYLLFQIASQIRAIIYEWVVGFLYLPARFFLHTANTKMQSIQSIHTLRPNNFSRTLEVYVYTFSIYSGRNYSEPKFNKLCCYILYMLAWAIADYGAVYSAAALCECVTLCVQFLKRASICFV